MFLHRLLPFYLIAFGGSAPVPRGTFPSPEKYPKGRIREGPFRWGPSLMNPSPATTQRGACPLWNPPSQSCGLPGAPCLFYLRGGNEFRLAPRFSPKAKTLVRRTPGGTALYLSCCPSGSPGGATHQNLSMSQSTFSALGASLASTY